MATVALFLTENPLVAIFACLGIGALIGKIKIGSFSLGATASTLIVAMAMCLWARQYAPFAIDKNLRTVFFAMFAFALGFDVGPSFFRALFSSGIRLVLMALFYALTVGLLTWLTSKIMGYGTATAVGFFAGAFTTSALTGSNPSDDLMLAYTMTYFIGTIGSIVFARYILPAILKVDLQKETKKKADSLNSEAAPASDRVGIVQVRAFTVGAECGFAGGTVSALENAVENAVEVEALWRGGSMIEMADMDRAVLSKGDVLVVVGDVSALDRLEGATLSEVSDAKYFQIRNKDAQIVLTTGADEEIHHHLTQLGIYVKEVERKGRRISNPRKIDLEKGDILHVYGPEHAVGRAVRELGYLKNNGITTDIPFFSIALMLGLIIGSISFFVMGKQISLGASFGAMLVGLISGWLYDRHPRFGHMSESTSWFVKTVGLNLFIAVLGLTSDLTLDHLLAANNLVMIAVAAVLVLAARIPVALFAKYVLKLDTVDLVGGLCGSGTNTPALNAVTEYTNSSLYALSFAPAYAVGNVMLILTGLVLGFL